jgi:hypothetical protein
MLKGRMIWRLESILLNMTFIKYSAGYALLVSIYSPGMHSVRQPLGMDIGKINAGKKFNLR